jgi:hypothetical protein
VFRAAAAVNWMTLKKAKAREKNNPIRVNSTTKYSVILV